MPNAGGFKAPSQELWYKFAPMGRPPQREEDVPSNLTVHRCCPLFKQGGHEGLPVCPKGILVDKLRNKCLEAFDNSVKGSLQEALVSGLSNKSGMADR
jgi:hypothetical protein